MAETTRFDFDHIFGMPIMDTFAYLLYIKEKRLREAAAIRKLKSKR